MERTIRTEMGAARDAVYRVMSDHRLLSEVAPGVILSVRVLSERPETYLAEERLALGGREYLSMVRHHREPPSLHEYLVVGGDAKGSRVTETFEEIPGGTRLTVTIDWKGGRLRKGDAATADTYHRLLEMVGAGT